MLRVVYAKYFWIMDIGYQYNLSSMCYIQYMLLQYLQ